MMAFIPLSVIIIARNEEKNIGRAIGSALNITDDIIVVDSGSTDNTRQIAQNLGAQVIAQDWAGYSKQKNIGNARAKYKYVFSLDADEEISESLQNELLDLLKQENLKTAYRINRLNHFAQKSIMHGAWYPDWHYRLFDKNIIHWIETDLVHESLNMDEKTSTENLKGNILHYTTETEDWYLEKMDKYARLWAKKMLVERKQSGALKAYSSACFRFMREYFFQAGFLDGKAGFLIARAHYIYTLKKYLYLKTGSKN